MSNFEIIMKGNIKKKHKYEVGNNLNSLEKKKRLAKALGRELFIFIGPRNTKSLFRKQGEMNQKKLS